MANTLQFLGIYPDTIETISERCEKALEEAGFSISEIDDMHDMVKDQLEECGTFADVTNSILDAYLSTTTDLLKERYKGINFSYYVNCDDSHLYVEVEGSEFGSQEYYSGEIEKAIKEAVREAVWLKGMEDLKEVIDTYEEALREVGLDEIDIAEMYNEAKERYNTIAGTEPDFADVSEAVLMTTVEYLERNVENDKIAFDYEAGYNTDGMQLLINGESYEPGAIQKALEHPDKKAGKSGKDVPERD